MKIKRILLISLVILILLILIPCSYVIYSFFKVRTGVIVFGMEAIVFTPRNLSEISKLDYNVNGEDWVWIGNNEKLSAAYEKYYSCFNESTDFLAVKIRYVNLFFPSKASYVIDAKMSVVYVIDIELDGEHAKCEDANK
jgi:hypothetical protein